MTDIQKVIQEQGPALVQQLTTRLGFNPQQAQAFKERLSARVAEVFKGGYDLNSLRGDLSGLIGKLNLGEIATQVGIDVNKATEGAKAVLPRVAEAFQKQGGFAGLAQSAGDAIKKSGGTFGKS